jgi:anthranilate/para-aminobenzoate synthase component I
VTTILAPSDPTLERLLALAGTLQPPLVLLEDGHGRGHTHLAWGAARRARRRFGEAGALTPAAAEGMPWYGVLGYEAGLPDWVTPTAPALAQPLADWFVPENRIVLGPDSRTVRLEGPEASDRWAGATDLAAPAPPRAAPDGAPEPWRSFDQAGFTAAVRRAREYIAAGDVYQVNLAQAERWAFSGNAWDAYRRLRAVNPSPWMGFADFGDWQLVCGSPELLIEVVPARDGGAGALARTRPIAGTRKKTGDAARDERMRAELRLDEKERAEHLMLVDLARNDLGRVSAYGSVHVAEREVVEEYSHVFHLVSEVRGRLRDGAGAPTVVEAAFPGGTITGCPKLRAIELIQELEPVGRGAYTGALGWIGADGLQLNIVIRSAVVSAGQVLVQAGAGIVADSIPEREWREARRKAAAVRLAFGLPGVGPE